MKHTLFSIVLACVVCAGAVIEHEQPQRILSKKFDENSAELALNAGLQEVKDAIALRAQIEARGHDFNIHPIPEFEAHLPSIEGFYKKAFEKSPKKLAAFDRLILAVRSAFKKKKVTLPVWNKFHLHLNDLVSADEKSSFKNQWNLDESARFDNFLCFVYRSHGEIGVRTKNFADANQIWVLPMTTAPELKVFNRPLSASEFTNALTSFYDAALSQQLLKVYERIEALETPEQRAKAQLALYNLLRRAAYYASSKDFLDDNGHEFLMNAHDALEDRIIGAGLNNTKSDIFRTLYFAGNDTLIDQIDDKHFSITEYVDGIVSRNFVATLGSDKEGKRVILYTDKEGKAISTPLESRTVESAIDRYSITLFKALGFDTSSPRFPAEVIAMTDEFVSEL